MMVPRECPGAAGATAVAGEREVESGGPEAAELIRHARRGGDLPAREGGARRLAQLVAQQQAEGAALACCQRKTARCREVGLAAYFCHYCRERAALQRLFSGEQRID